VKTHRPVLEQQKLDAFLEGASSTEKKPENTSQRKAALKQKTSITAKSSSLLKNNNSPKLQQRTIGKFQVEMPVELRKKIKYASVTDGMPMNDLIVAVLTKHFR